MKKCFGLAMLITLAFMQGMAFRSGAEEALPAPLGETLSASEFLAEVRRPFQRDAWGRFAGRINWAGDNRREKLPVRVAVRFGAAVTEAQIVLNEVNDYRIRQTYTDAGNGRTALTTPPVETGVTLFDLGIRAEDVTFAFIYWDLVRELERESLHHQACRVMDMRNSETGEFARVWFSVEALFPLQVWWYRPMEQEPWRRLEMKGFKRHEEGLWFVKSLLLRGDGWKTQIRFDDAEIFLISEKPSPADLFAGVGSAAAGNDAVPPSEVKAAPGEGE